MAAGDITNVQTFGGGSTGSISYTPSNVPNAAVFVCLGVGDSLETGVDPITLTWTGSGSIALAARNSALEDANAADIRQYVYVIPSPGTASGTFTIAFEFSGTLSATIFTMEGYSAVTTVAKITNNFSAGPASVTVASATGQIVLGVALTTFGETLTASSPQTSISSYKNGVGTGSQDTAIAVGRQAGAASVTADFALTASSRWRAMALDITLASSAPNLFFGATAVSGQAFGELATSAPSTATLGTGWVVAGLGVNQMARMAFGTKRTAGAFSATAQPSGVPDSALGDGFRTAATISGTYAAGTWTLQLPVIAVDAAGAQVRARFRIWRSANADMSGATEITSSTIVGSTVTALATGTAQISTGTVALGAITLANEYLFIQVALETV